MKKIISIIVCIAVVLALAVPAFAVDESSVQCPTVYIPGIASSNVYMDKDNPEERVEIPDKDTLLKLIQNEIAPALVVYAADKDADKLAMTVSKALNEAFKNWFNNSDGTPKGNSGAVNTYPVPSSIKGTSVLRFNYDWRGDPLVIAQELNEYINYITENSGYDKVALTAHSLGSVVILTYLSVYGSEKIMGVVLDTPTVDGVTYIGELLCGETQITGEAISTFLKGIFGTAEYQEIVASTLDIFEMAGVTDMLSDFLDDTLRKIGPTLFRETLLPMFGYWLTVWAMAPEDRLEEAMDYIFDDFYKDEDLSVLRGKIESYNSLVRKNRKETLLDFDKTGRVAVISRYGYSSIPLTASWALLSDAVVETKSNSLGATTAIAGDYFSDEYLEGKNMEYISPDRTVDASTCLFPEKTWFIKGVLHVEIDMTKKLHSELLFSEKEMTCDNSELPRFSLFDRETEAFIADETEPQKAEKPTPLERLFNFLKALFEKLIAFFRKGK